MATNETKEILNNIVLNSQDGASLLNSLPTEITSKIAGLINIAKIIGIILLVYIILKIIKSFFDIRRNIRIAKTYHKVNEIDKKIDLLLGKKRLKETDKTSKKQKSSKK